MRQQERDAGAVAAAIAACVDTVYGFLQERLPAVDLSNLMADLRRLHACTGAFLQKCLEAHQRAKASLGRTSGKA